MKTISLNQKSRQFIEKRNGKVVRLRGRVKNIH